VRYEHLTLDLSTAALAELRQVLSPGMAAAFRGTPTPVVAELMNLFNEIEARLQRRDYDPTCRRGGDSQYVLGGGFHKGVQPDNSDLTS